MIADFRWNEWNVNHIAEHGVEPSEAEYVVLHDPGARTIYIIHAPPLTDREMRRRRRRKRRR